MLKLLPPPLLRPNPVVESVGRPRRCVLGGVCSAVWTRQCGPGGADPGSVWHRGPGSADFAVRNYGASTLRGITLGGLTLRGLALRAHPQSKAAAEIRNATSEKTGFAADATSEKTGFAVQLLQQLLKKAEFVFAAAVTVAPESSRFVTGGVDPRRCGPGSADPAVRTRRRGPGQRVASRTRQRRFCCSELWRTSTEQSCC